MPNSAPTQPTSLYWGATACALIAGAMYLLAAGAPNLAYVPYLLVAEAAYLAWAARAGGEHRAAVIGYAIKLNVQAALRASIAFALGVCLLFAASALPGVSAIALFKLAGQGAGPYVGMAALFKMSLAASIGLAAFRLAHARRHGVTPRDMGTGAWLRPSIRLCAPAHVVEQALAQRLDALAGRSARRLGALVPPTINRIKRCEEDGHPITRVYFSFFSLRVTFAVRALDHRRTELRMWIRVRNSMRLVDLFPNPVAVTRLMEFIQDEVFAPLQRELEAPAAANGRG